MATDAQKRAVNKFRKKVITVKFDFNTEKLSDIEALNKFNELSKKFNSKKEALIYLINLSKE